MKHGKNILVAVGMLFTHLAVAGEISGVVLGHKGNPVKHATVVLCDQSTGIPVSKNTWRPFTENMQEMKTLGLVLTDANGKFRLKDVPNGCYRLIVQSWPDKPTVEEVFDKNGKRILLHGIANNLIVPSSSATSIVFNPLGKCVLSLDEEFPNSDALLLVSTKPLLADPVLGFICWQGGFMQNLIGANRMIYGVTEIAGLPEGKLYLSVFANDSNGGIGASTVEMKAGQKVKSDYISIVCGWSNGQHDPPEELEDTYNEIKMIANKKKGSVLTFINELLAEKGIAVEIDDMAKNPFSVYYPHLDKMVSLPSGREVRFADVLASLQYMQLKKRVEQRNK
jgi:hypothetical protein